MKVFFFKEGELFATDNATWQQATAPLKGMQFIHQKLIQYLITDQPYSCLPDR